METTEANLKKVDLLRLTHEAVKEFKDIEVNKEWMQFVFAASPHELVSLVGSLSSNEGYTPANYKAKREAVISEVQRKNTEQIVSTMKELDKTGARLTYASIAVAIVGGVLAAIQVIQGYLK